MQSNIAVTGFNSALYRHLKADGLSADVEIKRYSSVKIQGPCTLIIFNDVPLDECDSFHDWVLEITETNDVSRVIFCSSFVCDNDVVTPYARRKKYLEDRLRSSLHDLIIVLRLKNLLLGNGRWDRRLRHFRSRLVVNLSRQAPYFCYSDTYQTRELFENVIADGSYHVSRYHTFDVEKEAWFYLRVGLFDQPSSKANIVVKIIERLFPVIFVAGSEYTYDEE